MSDIFREVDEDLRRENLAKLWAKYGNYVLALAVLIVVLTAAVMTWRDYQAKQRRAESVRFAEAERLAGQGQSAAALDAFSSIAAEAGSGYGVLARFERAALLARNGDKPAAAAAYDAIAADRGVLPSYRDLAAVLAALHGLDSADPKAVIERLKPIAGAAENPYRPNALELTALAHLRAGERAAALDVYKTLADDLGAPPGLRARATEMVNALSAT